MRGCAKWAIGSVAALGLLVGAAGPAGAGAEPAGGRIAGSFAGEGDFVNDPCAIPEVTDTIVHGQRGPVVTGRHGHRGHRLPGPA